MSEWQFDHFPDGGHLLPAASDVIVSHVVQLLLVFAVDGLALSVEHRVWCHNPELLWLGGDDLELHWLEVSPHDEEVTLLDGSVCVFEVGDEVGLGEVALDALNCVGERQDMDFGQIGDVSCGADLYDVTESDSEIFADGLVHAYFAFFELVIDEGDDEGLFSFLALDEDGVALEDLELGHLGLAELDRRVLVVQCFLHLNNTSRTISLFGAFFWSRIAVDTSFFGSIKTKNI